MTSITAARASFSILTQHPGEPAQRVTVQGEVFSVHGAPALGVHESCPGQWSLTDLHSGLLLVKSLRRSDHDRLAKMLLGLYGEGGRWLDKEKALARLRVVCQAYMRKRWLDEVKPGAASPLPSSTKDGQIFLPSQVPEIFAVPLVGAVTQLQLRLWLLQERHALLEEFACVVHYGPCKVVIPMYTYQDSAVIGVEEALPWLARLEGVPVEDLIQTIDASCKLASS